jgi:hypothetical protein
MVNNRTISSMASCADEIIGKILVCGSRGMSTSPRTEVGLVAAVVLGAIGQIAAAWRPLLAKSGYQLGLTGVFCHAAPLVRFVRPNGRCASCELGDLLLVIDRIVRNRTTRTASLVQAKMASKASRVQLTGHSSMRQLSLYQSWPAFSFVDTSYGRATYNIKTSTGPNPGTFGIIDRHFKNGIAATPRWTQHEPTPTPQEVTWQPLLGTFVANMLPGNRHLCGCPAVPGGTDDWSMVVDLLLRKTYAKTFRHRSTLGEAMPRRGHTALAFLTHPRADAGWWPPFDDFDVVEDDSPMGMNVVHLALTERKD